jgi:hypothetical protein
MLSLDLEEEIPRVVEEQAWSSLSAFARFN